MVLLAVKTQPELILAALKNQNHYELSVYGNDGLFVKTENLWLYSSLVRSILDSSNNQRDIVTPNFSSDEVGKALQILEREENENILVTKTTRTVLETLGVNLDRFLEPAIFSTEKVVNYCLVKILLLI